MDFIFQSNQHWGGGCVNMRAKTLNSKAFVIRVSTTADIRDAQLLQLSMSTVEINHGITLSPFGSKLTFGKT